MDEQQGCAGSLKVETFVLQHVTIGCRLFMWSSIQFTHTLDKLPTITRILLQYLTVHLHS